MEIQGFEKIGFHGGKSLLVFFAFGFLIMLIRLSSKAGHPGIPCLHLLLACPARRGSLEVL